MKNNDLSTLRGFLTGAYNARQAIGKAEFEGDEHKKKNMQAALELNRELIKRKLTSLGLLENDTPLLEAELKARRIVNQEEAKRNI